MRSALVVLLLVATVAPARADVAWPRPIAGFEMRGKTKVTNETAEYLSHFDLGELVVPGDIPRLQQAFLSSELFEAVAVTLEPTATGVIVVATVEDKHSWIIGPTLWLLAGKRSVGLGFLENNLRGRNQKLVLYGQLGDRESFFFGAFVMPSLRGTPLTFRIDSYLSRKIVEEYANDPARPTDDTVLREARTVYLGGGVLLGWRFAWWLNFDLRMRGAYVYFRDAHVPGDPDQRLPPPELDGWDVSAQARLTLDVRHYRFGVAWGPYLQLIGDTTIPGLDDYDYSIALLRAYYSWRFFEEHQLELRGIVNVGRKLPFHEELTLGSHVDLRGYAVDRFRGDVRTLFRVEYSVPITKWKFFAFRGIGFWDTGYAGLHFPRVTPDRAYLPTQHDGVGWWRNDVGAGVRIYVKAVVLPLLGLDVAYGIEARSPTVYFQLGLTDL